ncbi:MAG: 3-isopropylmalate dehydratase [Candidatus Bathyarchaeia archaeon]
MGRAWVFGDSVSTDDIIPGIFSISVRMEEASSHAFEYVRPKFSEIVKPGDVIVAGENFGCGSSREAAVLAIKGSGVEVVIARSFGNIFFRNAVNNGLLVVKPKEEVDVQDGDEVEFDSQRMVLMNKTSGEEFEMVRPGEFLLDIISEGGLLTYLNRHGKYETR